MRDVRELVRREEILPDGEVPDLGSRIGGDGPEDDRRRVQRGENNIPEGPSERLFTR